MILFFSYTGINTIPLLIDEDECRGQDQAIDVFFIFTIINLGGLIWGVVFISTYPCCCKNNKLDLECIRIFDFLIFSVGAASFSIFAFVFSWITVIKLGYLDDIIILDSLFTIEIFESCFEACLAYYFFKEGFMKIKLCSLLK